MIKIAQLQGISCIS